MAILNKKEKIRQYYLKHRLKLIKYSKQYQLEHLKKYQLYRKLYNKLHKKEKQNYNAEYYRKNKIIINNKRNKYFKRRKKEDINFKILTTLRTRIWQALKGKSGFLHATELLGCNVEFLKKHLQKQFKNGMNWNNYGKWHIDHIKPCARFDLSKESEQKKCFYYTNLQPLWAKENLSKNRF